MYQFSVWLSHCLSALTPGVSAPGGGAPGGAEHRNSWGTDLHAEGGTGETAGGAGRYPGQAERDQQPVDCAAGQEKTTHFNFLIRHFSVLIASTSFWIDTASSRLIATSLQKAVTAFHTTAFVPEQKSLRGSI